MKTKKSNYPSITFELGHLTDEIITNLFKAERGNMAAAQRLRMCTLRFEKLALAFRKESVKAAKSGEMKSIKKKLKSLNSKEKNIR